MGHLERNTQVAELVSAEQVFPVVSQEAFLNAMAQLPTAVSLVTTGEGVARMGLTVSALASLSAEPPSILVCVNKSASAHKALLENRKFAVNLLSTEQQDFASLFAQKGVDRFASSKWQQGTLNVPVLEGALLNLECRLEQVVDSFSHSILVGVIERLHSAVAVEGKPVIWYQRQFCEVVRG